MNSLHGSVAGTAGTEGLSAQVGRTQGLAWRAGVRTDPRPHTARPCAPPGPQHGPPGPVAESRRPENVSGPLSPLAPYPCTPLLV